MTARLIVSELTPAAYKAMVRLDTVTGSSDLPQPLQELVRVRASQINGCAYCVDQHSADAKKAGVADSRLWAVATWREAPCFDDAERAALDLTESMTRLSEGGDRVADGVWEAARAQFGDEDLAALIMLITMINAWNRIGVTTRMVPESFADAA
ncbi:carboxymuconolactone decarboxylase family protein [Occultella aeris]|uniref:Carboxymuconolactone decarboxylase family protein n=1 Tax=Occultella aeris TaxID=2761496 RepID=A0A7M4DF25_9MICO|nr:carboxymuconolactone decarboxylase family protein [Occultella aeris]VZO35518.1 Carboxymuconolactone decarboxylase family protein [Occultella aeris]